MRERGQTVRFIIRIMFASVGIVVIAMSSIIAYVFGVEPIFQALAGPPASLGWDNPGAKAMNWGVISLLGIALVFTLWFIFAPIQQDRRQEVRQRRRP